MCTKVGGAYSGLWELTNHSRVGFFRRGVFKGKALKQSIQTELLHRDSLRKIMCLLNIKACKLFFETSKLKVWPWYGSIWPTGPMWWFYSGVDIIFPQAKVHQLLQILFLFSPSRQPQFQFTAVYCNYEVIYLKTCLKLNLNHCFMVKVKFRLCCNGDASRKWILKILCHIKETLKFRIYDLAEAKHYFYKLWFFSLNRIQKANMNRKLCTHEVEVITSWNCIIV